MDIQNVKLCRWTYLDTLTGTHLVSPYMTEIQAIKSYGPLLVGPILPCLRCKQHKEEQEEQVRGYKVTVKHVPVSPEEAASKRDSIGRILAESALKQRKSDNG